MKEDSRHHGSQGFSLVELLVSLLVFGVVIGASLQFLVVQNQGFRKGLDHMSTIQLLRHTSGTLEQNIRTAGTNLVTGQPGIVYAGGDILAFNADYATGNRDDPYSVFFEPDLEDAEARTMLRSQRRALPSTTFFYPDSTYLDGSGRPGPAETLIFFFESDSQTAREDDFALFRQMNAQEPELVAKNLLRVGGEPFFRYLKEGPFGVEEMESSLLPLSNRVPVHGSPADPGLASLVDSIRAVRVTLAATNGREGEGERKSEITRLIRMPNMGFGRAELCGRAPILGTKLMATVGHADTGEATVTLTWGRATDEEGGEEDIIRYVIWRRDPGRSGWGKPYLSIPAGESQYKYVDSDLMEGKTYQYALATQDCTPALSPYTASAAVTVPFI